MSRDIPEIFLELIEDPVFGANAKRITIFFIQRIEISWRWTCASYREVERLNYSSWCRCWSPQNFFRTLLVFVKNFVFSQFAMSLHFAFLPWFLHAFPVCLLVLLCNEVLKLAARHLRQSTSILLCFVWMCAFCGPFDGAVLAAVRFLSAFRWCCCWQYDCVWRPG